MLATIVRMLLMMAGGAWLYMTPVANISIDINPSLELSVNRLERVIDVRGYNVDGIALAATLDVRFMGAEQAVNCILGMDEIQSMLLSGEPLSIGVVGADQPQCARLLQSLEAQTASCPNAHCYAVSVHDVEDAHAVGLSYGKYREWVILKNLGSEITAEEISTMTMKEIHSLVESLSGVPDECLECEYFTNEGRGGCRRKP